MSRQIIAYIVIIVGVLGTIFFGNYTGFEHTVRLVLWYVFILINILGLYLWVNAFINRKKKRDKRAEGIIKYLKEDGEKILVDLSKCEIKENDYTMQADRLSLGKTAVLDAMYDSSKNIKSIDINQCVLIYIHSHNGVDEKFISPIIARTRDDLRIKLYLVKTTSIYVNKNDRSKYYFDLDFLNPS